MFYNQKFLFFFIVSIQILKSQNDNGHISSYFNPLNDPTQEGQTKFVQELMDIAGYNPEKIEIYQTLPNRAKVFRVKLDSVNGGFVFIRWDSKKKENYVANKMIDPGVYFNLKAAKEIMRKQTDKAYFTVEDVLPQAPDQEQINIGELNQFREEFELKEEEKRLEQEEAQKSKPKKEKSKEKTKKKLFN
jgi:hypothetical protein